MNLKYFAKVVKFMFTDLTSCCFVSLLATVYLQNKMAKKSMNLIRKSHAFLLLVLVQLAMINSIAAQTSTDILVVGAGGSGGAHQAALANTGGGGGGGVVYVTGTTLTNGTYSVGVASTTPGKSNGSSGCGGLGNNGANSTFTRSGGISITANGGGGGGGCGVANGNSGGSGGGGHCGGTGGSATKGSCSGNTGGTVTTYGSAGGTTASGCTSPSGGGGGASAAGTVSNGGQGVSISITGVARVYGSGGGGNATTGGSGGTNAGFGASGVNTTGNGGNLNATDNFGGGGGGTSCGSCTSGSGGSGVVIIRYASQVSLVSGVNGGSGQATCTSSSYTGNGTNGTLGVVYQVHVFTGGGTFVLTNCISAHPSAANQNVCINGSATAISVTANGTSPTYQWYSNTTASNAGGTLITGATSASYTPPTTIAGRTFYYCFVTTTNNGSAYSSVSGAVNVGSISGSISGATTVTSSTNSTTLTLNDNAGSIQWQSSTNNTTFSDIGSATASTYTATNITQTTYYRVRVTNGACPAVFSSSVAILYQPGASAATTASITASGGTTAATNNTATTVDGAISVTSNGNLSGFSVSITSNYTSGDSLSYTGTLPSGITAAAFNTTSRSLVFSGSASAADWQNLLRRVQIKTTSATCNPETRGVTFTASTNYYNYFNGHFYEYSPTIRSWTAAKAYAESQSFFGRKGYLVTVSSAAENAFIYSLINFDTWIGCSDNFSQINGAVGFTKYSNQSNAEGKWHWITGPEKGVQIRTGNASTAENPGSPISGVYQNWNTTTSYSNNEPNDVWNRGVAGQEDYGHLWGNSGKWNDFPNNGRACIVEYGDMPGDNPVSTLATTKVVSVTGMATGNILAASATVCTSTNSTNLTYSPGAGNTVVRWESSPDNFLVTTNQIVSTSSSYISSNISATTTYRVVVASGACTTVTAPVTITYSAIIPGTIVSNNATICENTPAMLTLSGCSGSVTKWQVSTSTTTPRVFTDIPSSASTEVSHTLTSAGTYYFRAVVNNAAGCATQNSDEYTVTVSASATPAGGEVSSNAHCGINNSGTLVLSGASGSSYSWEFSTNNGSTWSSASNTTTTLNYTNIAQNRLYRVLVSDGACGSTYSSAGSITIYGTSKCLFTGATSGSWADPLNWCGGVIADNGSDVDISPTCRFDILLDKNRSIGQLNFLFGSKYLRLGNFNLTVNSITGHDSLNHIKITGTGVLRMGLVHGSQKTFPIGKSTYNPVSITNKTNQTDTFTTSLLDEVYGKGTCCSPLNTPRIKRTWLINKGNGTSNAGDGVDFTFNWYKDEISGSIGTFRMYHYDGTSWNKINPVSSTVVDTAYFTHNGYKGSFSPFAMGDNVTALPVNWLSMGCSRVNEKQALVQWATASETQSDSFVVERSLNGQNFTRVGAVKAAGNSSEPRQYSLTDNHAVGARAFYRVKQTDLDGESSNSEICSVLPVNDVSGALDIYPNPANDVLTVVNNAEETEVLTLRLIDMAGKEVLRVRSEQKITKLATEKLRPGVYLFTADGPEGMRTAKKLLIYR